MESKISLDYIDSKPCLRIDLNPSEDPTDKLLKELVMNKEGLTIKWGEQENIGTQEEPEYKRILWLVNN